MSSEVPDEVNFSLNETAKRIGMGRQEFRILVKEFEQRVCKLPIRYDEQNQGNRVIPEDFFHIFEEAYLWMRTLETTPGEGVARALHMHRSGQLEHLARAVSDRAPLLALPKELQVQTLALVEAAKVERPVAVELRGQRAHIDAITVLSRRAERRWWLITGVAILSAVLGALGGSWHTNARLATVMNDSQYRTDRQLDRIEHLVKIRARP